MNAYELAKELDEYNKDGMPVFVVGQSVTMLRQQADRIAELEKEKQEQALQRLSDFTCIAELEDRLSFYELKDLDITLQTKPLSDEEIIELADIHLRTSFIPFESFAFARAIEAKHGIC